MNKKEIVKRDKTLFKIFDFICKKTGMKKLLFYKKSNNFPVLLYHSLNPNIDGVEKYQFEEHIKFLSKNYDMVSLKTLMKRIKECKTKGNELVITFDDGFLDTAKIAIPILQKYNAKATVFVATDLINTVYRNEKMIDEENIIKLYNIGVEIGSHTKSHVDLTSLSSKELEIELKESKKTLEEIINDEVCSISYPFGLNNKNVRYNFTNKYYRYACTVFHDFYNDYYDNVNIPRFIITPSSTIDDVKSYVTGDRNWFKIVDIFTLNFIAKKHARF